jgi:glycerol uptake facilitator-like aquaporin
MLAPSFSELLGTFFLVLVCAGGAVVNAKSHGAISRMGVAR